MIKRIYFWILKLFFIIVAVCSLPAAAHASLLLDAQPVNNTPYQNSAGGLGTNNFFQYLRNGVSGSPTDMTIYVGTVSAGWTADLRFYDITNSSSTLATFSVTVPSTVVGTNQEAIEWQNISGITFDPTHQYAFAYRFTSGGTAQDSTTWQGTSAVGAYLPCLSSASTQGFNSVSNFTHNCGTITASNYSLQYSPNVQFANPPQSLGYPGSQMPDFLNWQILLSGINTTTPTELQIKTFYGVDNFDLSNLNLATATTISIQVLKGYPLNVNASTSNSYLPLYATASLIKKSNNSVYASNTTYFGIYQSTTTNIPFYGVYGIPSSTAGSLFDLGGSNYFPQTSSTPVFNDSWIRQSLGSSLPFSYFFQVGDILNSISSTTDSNTASITPFTMQVKIGGATTTLFTVDSNTPTKIIPITYWNNLRNILTLALWLYVLPHIWGRIKTLWQGGYAS